MHLIVGHTTHESCWIWVRGDRKNRRLEVEIRAVCSGDSDPDPQLVEVDARGDYTEVARFEKVLKENTSYRVLLRSKRGFPLADGPNAREIEGRFRTFPEPGQGRPFQFIHGSCNLSNARLIALGSMAAGVGGHVATHNVMKRPVAEWYSGGDLCPCLRFLGWPGIRQLTRCGLLAQSWITRAALYLTTHLTRFEQPTSSIDQTLPTPELPSPFVKLVDEIEGFDREEARNRIGEEDAATRPDFMIHAGDQIYFDVEFPARKPSIEHYRRNYRQAWFQDESTRRMLRLLPNYMILDDHEILDNFGTDADEAERAHIEPALDAYDEYVSARQPQRRPGPAEKRHQHHKGYAFEHGDTGFFVLDTRTKRSVENGHMIDPAQEKALESWLRGEGKDKALKLRFIVSSVPFVAQLRPAGFDRSGKRRDEKQADRWSGPAWQEQRERIIRLIHELEMERLVFLVGDMHCAYHASMRIGLPDKSLTIHELAGGPINQLLFAKRDDFYARYRGTFKPKDSEQELPWVSTLEAFHGAAPSVLRVSVTPPSGPEPKLGRKRTPLEIHWRVERTRSAVDERPRREIRSILEKVKPGIPPSEVCREYGVRPETLYRWRMQEDRRREEERKRGEPGKHNGVNGPARAADDSPTLASPDPHPLCGSIRFHRQPEEWA